MDSLNIAIKNDTGDEAVYKLSPGLARIYEFSESRQM